MLIRIVTLAFCLALCLGACAIDDTAVAEEVYEPCDEFDPHPERCDEYAQDTFEEEKSVSART